MGDRAATPPEGARTLLPLEEAEPPGAAASDRNGLKWDSPNSAVLGFDGEGMLQRFLLVGPAGAVGVIASIIEPVARTRRGPAGGRGGARDRPDIPRQGSPRAVQVWHPGPAPLRRPPRRPQFQCAFPLRQSLSRLCVPHNSFHSPDAPLSPLRRKRPTPRASLICPNTGSTVRDRFL